MVFRVLKQFLDEGFACDPDGVEMGTALDDLNLSSSDLTELLFMLSERFGVEISDEQAARLETVEDIVACVEDQM